MNNNLLRSTELINGTTEILHLVKNRRIVAVGLSRGVSTPDGHRQRAHVPPSTQTQFIHRV